jgi:hypothetical protein
MCIQFRAGITAATVFFIETMESCPMGYVYREYEYCLNLASIIYETSPSFLLQSVDVKETNP